MKKLHLPHLLLALFVIAAAGFYTLDYRSSEASVFKLPDFTSTTDIPDAASQPINNLQDFNDAIVGIADQTKETVVTVNTTRTVEPQEQPLLRYFGDPRGGGPQQFERRGLGSGVIVSSDGYLLTNNHVVEGADEINVTLLNGDQYSAKIVGFDPQTDIAVLKIEAENLPVIEMGDSDALRVGEMVLAIGSPLNQNLAHSVSMGIISAKGRSIGILREAAGYEDFIQTDAAINPGNSGGALINMDGELIGINSAIASRSGGNEGIGFAIPVNLASSIMESLIENGEVVRGYLGVTTGGIVDRTMARALGLEKAQGFIIGEVVPGEAAEAAGLQVGDVVTTLNGQPIRNYDAFRTQIATSKPGTEVTLGYIRDGEEHEVEVTLGSLSSGETGSPQQPRQDTPDVEQNLGLGIGNLTPEISRRLELDQGTEGVVVMRVVQGGKAHRQGLREGDVITRVQDEPVSNVREFQTEMEEIVESGRDVVLLRIIRAGITQFIALEL